MSSTPTIWIAFLAGLASFVSPCTLPLYPSYISYISGVSYDRRQSQLVTSAVRRKALAHAVFFVLGFSVIFIALGASANLIGFLFAQYRSLLSEIGGVIVIFMGLILLKVVKFDMLMREAKWHAKVKPAGYLGAFVIGVSFSAGWTPCIGPILASVIAIAATSQVNGAMLMTAYALGFAIPFLILAYTLGSVRFLQRYSEPISRIGGAVLVLMGVLLLTHRLEVLTSWMTRMFGAGATF
ncbi:cytochrome c biogenesis CcdA family protein [Sulfoacidibacillus thermotolerans]|uniref:Cytochrome C biogenesis protein n=1 Tax=Sulfoacidibacillus thermotolerans TaxID=1765684 RepID=A0A2U3D6P0_SULT2|nr:cytochrome c biogenesis protein CcdA [Sulfoacidibacillus thermotolerans]PWI56946.1 cytochrome C biogenesis protein [Sulfoacidibacillus thermotolerans]